MSIGRVNTGGGGATGATLTVTGVAGDTVTITKDSKTYTRTFNSDGVAVFKGLATGTWTATMTNGTQTSTMTVVVTADYQTSISYFTATINVTYPAGSTCTATDGTTTLTAPDTSGSWTCVVPNAGTWTVTCNDSAGSISETFSDIHDGSNEHLAFLSGWKVNDGHVLSSGPYSTGTSYGLGAKGSARVGPPLYINVMYASQWNLTTQMDVTPYKTVIYYRTSAYMMSSASSDAKPRLAYAITSSISNSNWVKNAAVKQELNTKGGGTYRYDITSLTGNFYICIWVGGDDSVYQFRNVVLRS